MAPEIEGLMIPISKAVDIWAYGIVLYKLAVAYFPTSVFNYKYTDGPLPFYPRDWKYFHPDLKDLIQKCVRMNPADRLTSAQILEHNWIK